jgi:hypothetical protein
MTATSANGLRVITDEPTASPIRTRICARCPVMWQCRDWALANPSLAEFGVWGGLSEAERRSLRRRAVRAER